MAALQDKTALVTGASRGIGRATASALAEAGDARPASRRPLAQEAGLAQSLHLAKGGRADEIEANWGTPEGATLLAKKFVRSLGSDWMFSCPTPESQGSPITDYTVEDFDNLFATNVRSPFFLVQQLYPSLVTARTSL